MTRRGRTLQLIGVVGLAILAGSCEGSTEPEPKPGLALAYVGAPTGVGTGSWELWTLAADGTTRRRLAGRAGLSACSPDGLRIVYLGYTLGQARLYVVNTDGGASAEIQAPGLSLGPAAWSPDGQRLAVHYQHTGTTTTGIALINVDGSGFMPLANPGRSTGTILSWTPDGREILYTAPNGYDVLAVNVNARATRFVASNAWYARMSPDGRRLAFVQRSGSGGVEIAVMEADAGSRRAVAPGVRYTWSSDSRRIIYEETTTQRLYEVEVDGGQPKPLGTRDWGQEAAPHMCGTP